MLQGLIIAYLSFTAACGPLLCCCTFRALGGKQCCANVRAAASRSTRCSKCHEACGRHGHCAQSCTTAQASLATSTSDEPQPPHQCPCRKPHERQLHALCHFDASAIDWVDVTAADTAIGQSSLASSFTSASNREVRRSRFGGCDSGREILRACSILRC